MKSVIFETSGTGSPSTTAWHDWRAQGIGASDAPIIAAHCGLIEAASWMSTQHKLWEMKLGLAEKPKVNAAMMRGTNYEGAARDAVEEVTGLVLSPVFGEMDESPFIRASFDGRDFDGNTIVEIKCPSEKVHGMAKNGEVVGYYVPQLIHQALVAWGLPGSSWVNKLMIFASYVPETGDLALVHKTGPQLMNEFDVEKLYIAEQDFWESVQTQQPICGPEFLKLADDYKEIVKRFDIVEAEKEACRLKLIELLGKRKRLEGNGVSVSQSTSKPSVDWEAITLKIAQRKKLTVEEIEAEKLVCLKKARSSFYVTIQKGENVVS